MARKRKQSAPLPTPPPPSSFKDCDSDSALGSPDSCSSRSGSGSAVSCSGAAGGANKQEKPPLVRSAANARERSRMRVLSKAFSRLKTTLPWVPADTKLSKLDTLRLAACYIAHLREVLAEDNLQQTPNEAGRPAALSVASGKGASAASAAAGVGVLGKAGTGSGKMAAGSTNGPIHPISLTWPFTFNGRVAAPKDALLPATPKVGGSS